MIKNIFFAITENDICYGEIGRVTDRIQAARQAGL